MFRGTDEMVFTDVGFGGKERTDPRQFLLGPTRFDVVGVEDLAPRMRPALCRVHTRTVHFIRQFFL